MISLSDRIISLLQTAQKICAAPGKWAAYLILLLIVTVSLTIVFSWLGFNQLVGWESRVPVFGDALTVNSMIDLQRYLFAVLIIFGGVYALNEKRHVSVDFVSSRLSRNQQLIVRVIGDLFLLIPFCMIITWYGISFALTAYVSEEGSTYGGLLDRWIIKACIPIGFSLLAIAALARTLITLIRFLIEQCMCFPNKRNN